MSSTTPESDHETEIDTEFVWPFLADSYSNLEDAWWDLVGRTDRESAEEARQRPVPNRVRVVGEMTGLMAGGAVGGHLGLLSRAYWPPRTERDATPINHLSIYPPARAAIEALAIACWALDSEADDDERGVRAAELWLWSVLSGPGRDVDGAVSSLRAEGYDITHSGGRRVLLKVDGITRKVTMSMMVECMLRLPTLYGLWSSIAHSDPFSLFDFADGKRRDDGMVDVQFRAEPILHLFIAGVVASSVAEGARCHGGRYGPDPTALVDQCGKLNREIGRLMSLVDPDLVETIEKSISTRSEGASTGTD